MKSKFLYPTRRNSLVGLLLAQLFPIIVLGASSKYNRLSLWVAFELVILGAIIMWRLKPDTELDEREKEITLKWKSRLLDYGSSIVLLPLTVLSFQPEISGWNLMILTGIPAYLVYVLFSLMAKKEIGYFFYQRP